MAKAQSNAGHRVRNRKVREPLQVLVVRHAIAKDPGEFAQSGAPDAERPLTKQGRKRMREAANGLAALVSEVGVIATSPLTRAVETAEILVKRYGKLAVEVEIHRLSALAPSKPANVLLDWLAEQPRDKPVVLVGHEPHLGQFVSWALTGLRDSFVEFKKGAAVMLVFEDEIRPGRARLQWALRPGHLRKIGEAVGG